MPRTAPSTLPGLDGHCPVFAARPDSQEVGAVLRELTEYLFRLCKIYVLTFTNEGQVLADGKERGAFGELQEARVLPTNSEETLA